MSEFKSIFIDSAKEHNIEQYPTMTKDFYDITPENVFNETGCQIFKNGETCESYLLYEKKLYILGKGFGGYGVVDITTCDFDKNGENEILYTYSWGSGLHRSIIAYFDFSNKSEVEVKVSSPQPSKFIKRDLVFKKLSNTEIEVYTAKINGLNFGKLGIQKDKLFGEIKAVDNKPVLFIK